MDIRVDKINRLSQLQNIPRVELPSDVPDDSHNRIGGLVDLIRENIPRESCIVEVGTGMGVSTEVFALLCKHIITIDPFYPGSESWFRAAKLVVDRYKNITQHITTDDIVAKSVKDNSINAVYLDGAHDYESVKNGILRWLPKINRNAGGVICGHDHISRPKYNFGVIDAVREIFGTPDAVYPDTSWIVILGRR